MARKPPHQRRSHVLRPHADVTGGARLSNTGRRLLKRRQLTELDLRMRGWKPRPRGAEPAKLEVLHPDDPRAR